MGGRDRRRADNLTHAVQNDRMLHVISRLEGKPEKYMEWLTKNLERLDSINTVRTNVRKAVLARCALYLHKFKI